MFKIASVDDVIKWVSWFKEMSRHLKLKRLDAVKVTPPGEAKASIGFEGSLDDVLSDLEAKKRAGLIQGYGNVRRVGDTVRVDVVLFYTGHININFGVKL